MRFKLRFTLRFVLIVVFVVACLLALWRTRPAPFLRVELTSTGTVIVRDEEIEAPALPDVLAREAKRRKIWFVERRIRLLADYSVRTEEIQKMIRLAQEAGFEKFALALRDQPQRKSDGEE